MRLQLVSLAMFIALPALPACHDRVDTARLSGSGSGMPDAAGGGGTCTTPPWVFPNVGPEPSWVTSSCPAGGCPTGTTCVHATEAARIVELGCAPVPTSCGGNPSCGCMGCACGGTSTCDSSPLQPGVVCDTGTVSRRAAKDDVVYVDGEQRAALAREALAIPLARYRYKNEPNDARRRLGFIIDDQPDPSPAVLADRTHVDEYGYTSMLLATVQQQSQEIAELRRRIDKLESTAPRAR
jgi:hypothetical protein